MPRKTRRRIRRIKRIRSVRPTRIGRRVGGGDLDYFKNKFNEMTTKAGEKFNEVKDNYLTK